MRLLACALALLVASCGGAIDDSDGGSDSGGSDSAAKDGATKDVGADATGFACGIASCSGDAICIHPCCGGAQLCEAMDDGGTCLQGFSISQVCPPDQPCSNACTPPPPYCGSKNDCGMVQGHDCYFACN